MVSSADFHRARQLARAYADMGITVSVKEIVKHLDHHERAVYASRMARERKERNNNA